MPLNEKQKRFCEEYLKDLNASQAAIRAGYSAKTARACSSRMLTNANIQEYIQQRQKELQQSTGVTQEKIIQELAALAFTDIRKFYNEDGSLKKITELDADAAAALAGVETEELYAGFGEDRIAIGQTKKIKRWDKNKALENLARHLGMFNDKLTVNADEQMMNLFKTVMRRGQ
jgi:phage terminase small subunit